MREYKFYFIDRDGHVGGPPERRELPDDLTAIKHANLLALTNDVEVWQGTRMIAYVVADETKQTPPPKGPDFDQHR
jgi:hypothetical protein